MASNLFDRFPKLLNEDHKKDPNAEYQLSLLKLDSLPNQMEDTSLAPIFTGKALSQPGERPPQYSLLGGLKSFHNIGFPYPKDRAPEADPRLFLNVASPSSTFICGSQGSGKSHTLSCMLEGCLIPSRAGKLSNPLTAIVFHYDTFICDDGGSPCEAAFLSSNPNIKVRVLCAPTNLRTLQRAYEKLNVTVEPLQIDQRYLNTKRMMDLMAVGQDKGPMPLYMHTIMRVLREMRLVQQQNGTIFDYKEFKNRLFISDLTPAQLDPLKQRLETLESFMPPGQSYEDPATSKKKLKTQCTGSNWVPKASHLTIVDLSCPCISPDTACSLFNICFEIFMEQNTKIGRIVALDEAHKYMKDSIEARSFTDTLLSTVRLQRHLGARIVISTQEPTISKDLLGLCSVTIVHRFSSPAWLKALEGHVAAVALGSQTTNKAANSEPDQWQDLPLTGRFALFQKIVDLRVGEALLFAPSAVLDTHTLGSNMSQLGRLGSGYMTVKIRDRLTEDGGKSVISS